MEHIKIITINTWKCDGDYARRLPILTGQLRALKPAIVACQECFASEDVKADTLKYVADELHMFYSFVPGRAKKRLVAGQRVDSQSGLGILSAYPISNVREFRLPPMPGDEDRKAQQAEITLPAGTTIMITNTHLTHLRTDPDARRRQAQALAEITGEDTNCPYHLVCGDFNAVKGSAEINAFVSGANAIDCYAAGHGAEPRYSLADAFANNKLICVDHIFALPLPDGKGYPEFIDSAVVLNIADEASGLYPSDHFGIGTTLVIP